MEQKMESMFYYRKYIIGIDQPEILQGGYQSYLKMNDWWLPLNHPNQWKLDKKQAKKFAKSWINIISSAKTVLEKNRNVSLDNINIRKATEGDIPQIKLINDSESEWVGEESEDFFKRYLDISFFLVAINKQDEVIGFVMVMDGNEEYDSINFLWFKQKYNNFRYIDRIVIKEDYRLAGIADKLYNFVSVSMVEDNRRSFLVVKVSIEPLNLASKKFHLKKGFQKVGKLKDKKSCNMYRVDYQEYLKWKKNKI